MIKNFSYSSGHGYEDFEKNKVPVKVNILKNDKTGRTKFQFNVHN